MGTFSRVKKYKAFFTDKQGKDINYTTFVYAEDSDKAQEMANNILRDMNDDNLSHATVVYVVAKTRNWSGLYR